MTGLPVFERTVFINCPFDERYLNKLHAIVFVVLDCGLRPSLAIDVDNADQHRLIKITKLVRNAKFGIHDISATTLSGKLRYPRFNMPFELGLSMGASRFESPSRRRRLLILEGTNYSYLATLSDIAGHDAKSHGNTVIGVIEQVRSFFSRQPGFSKTAGTEDINKRFQAFKRHLPKIAASRKISRTEIKRFSYLADYIGFADAYLRVLKGLPSVPTL